MYTDLKLIEKSDPDLAKKGLQQGTGRHNPLGGCKNARCLFSFFKRIPLSANKQLLLTPCFGNICMYVFPVGSNHVSQSL